MPFQLRPPQPPEWPICRMLLPETFADFHGREYLLCLRESAPRLVGAVSFRRAGESLTGLRVHIVPPLRRAGAASWILSCLAASGPVTLTGVVDLWTEPGAASFCEQAGFLRTNGLTTVDAAVAEMRAYLGQLRARMPELAGFSTALLPDVPLAEIAALHSEHIAHERDLNPWRARLAAMPALGNSPVVLLHGQVAGMLLWEAEGQTGVVRSLVAKPGPSSRWINLMLLSAASEGGWSLGMRRVRFSYADANANTRKLAKRFKAQRTGELAEYTRPRP